MMLDALQHIFAEHWKFLMILMFLICVVQGMPTPGINGNPKGWAYRWLFVTLHAFTFQWMRLLALASPELAKLISPLEYSKNEPPKLP